MEWKDTTSYKRGETVRKPTCWTLEDPDKLLRVVVVFGHVHAPGHWVFHCPQLQFDTVDLLSVPQSPGAGEQAKFEAMRCVMARIQALSDAAMEMAAATQLSNVRNPSCRHE
jgi:hypothetical protein